ncbi:MAG TPA: 3-phosphoshikimate 1-carboxyvinyltransferase, partial [Planctomycetota bacterium]|nr:3-phosphoshikimate 1-carboxyvinyltransferase [Planctomycetota bacterium]
VGLARGEADTDPRGDLRATGAELSAFDIAPEDVPDLIDELPILALIAARARGRSRFAGLGELRVKESDRVATIAVLLAALGVPVEVGADSLTISGVEAFARPSRWPPLDDHRLALTAAVAAAASGWPLPDLSAAEVSFPGFAARLATLEATVA